MISEHRDNWLEKSIMLASKVNFLLQAGMADNLQKIMQGRPVGEFGFANDRNSVDLAHPSLVNGVVAIGNTWLPGNPGTAPTFKRILGMEYGNSEEQFVTFPPEGCIFPLLYWLAKSNGNGKDYLSAAIEEAYRIAPLLPLTGEWGEDALTKPELTWKPLYQEFSSLFGYTIHNICDWQGFCRRRVLEIRTGDNRPLLLPLSLAQHRNFTVPMICFFSFEKDWYFHNSEKLWMFPDAPVTITTELDLAQTSANHYGVCLGYYFGAGMIPHLHLEDLRGRSVTVQVEKSRDFRRWQNNLREALLMVSRLKAMEMPPYCSFFDPADPYSVYNQSYDDIEIDRRHLLQEAEQVLLANEIPDNLKNDRYGAVIDLGARDLIRGLLTNRDTLGIVLHFRSRLPEFVRLLNRMLIQEPEFFCKRWEKAKNLKAVFFLNPAKGLCAAVRSELPLIYTFPDGKGGEIEKMLDGCRRETGANLFIFVNPTSGDLPPKVLENACIWAGNHSVGTIILTVEPPSAQQETSLNLAKNQLHIWAQEDFNLVVERVPQAENEPPCVLLRKQGDAWSASDGTEQDLYDLQDRKICATTNIIKTDHSGYELPCGLENRGK